MPQASSTDRRRHCVLRPVGRGQEHAHGTVAVGRAVRRAGGRDPGWAGSLSDSGDTVSKGTRRIGAPCPRRASAASAGRARQRAGFPPHWTRTRGSTPKADRVGGGAGRAACVDRGTRNDGTPRARRPVLPHGLVTRGEPLRAPRGGAGARAALAGVSGGRSAHRLVDRREDEAGRQHLGKQARRARRARGRRGRRPARPGGRRRRAPRVMWSSRRVQSARRVTTPSRRKRSTHLRAAQRHALVDLAGQAPGGGEVDEDRLALARAARPGAPRSTPPSSRPPAPTAVRCGAGRPVPRARGRGRGRDRAP